MRGIPQRLQRLFEDAVYGELARAELRRGPAADLVIRDEEPPVADMWRRLDSKEEMRRYWDMPGSRSLWIGEWR